MKVTLWEILLVVFVVLKLTHLIAWSWWWVLLPLYGPLTVVVTVFGVCAFIDAVRAGSIAENCPWGRSRNNPR